MGFIHESKYYKLNGMILKDILTPHIYGIINDVTFQPANFFSTTSHRHILCHQVAISGIELNTTKTEMIRLGEEQEEREYIIVDS